MTDLISCLGDVVIRWTWRNRDIYNPLQHQHHRLHWKMKCWFILDAPECHCHQFLKGLSIHLFASDKFVQLLRLKSLVSPGRKQSFFWLQQIDLKVSSAANDFQQNYSETVNINLQGNGDVFILFWCHVSSCSPGTCVSSGLIWHQQFSQTKV